MTGRYEYMTSAIRDDGVRVDVAEALKDTEGKHRYCCADCKMVHGRNVELIPVHGHDHTYKREKIDIAHGQPVMTGRGNPVGKSKILYMPPHFKRAPGAEKHACSHDVAFADFRSTALYLNAVEIDHNTHAHLFSLNLPRHGVFDHNSGGGTQFRPKGMTAGGIRDARDFGKLLDRFEQHAGLQHYQLFQDMRGEQRSFTEVHFEDGKALLDYLERHDAVGRDQAILCSYLLNPNTSYQARAKVPEGDGFIDRDVSKMPDDRKLNIFARGANRQTIQALSDAAYENGVFNKTLVQVFGECWIEDAYLDEKTHHVEIEIYDPRQVMPWNRKGGFVPPYNSRLGDNDLILAL